MISRGARTGCEGRSCPGAAVPPRSRRIQRQRRWGSSGVPLGLLCSPCPPVSIPALQVTETPANAAAAPPLHHPAPSAALGRLHTAPASPVRPQENTAQVNLLICFQQSASQQSDKMLLNEEPQTDGGWKKIQQNFRKDRSCT